MAELDIRDNGVSEIDTIRFGESDVLYFDKTEPYLVTIAFDGENPKESETAVYIKDIPNLIKALQKAQELWGVDNK